jgi:hypothetical protein
VGFNEMRRLTGAFSELFGAVALSDAGRQMFSAAGQMRGTLCAGRLRVVTSTRKGT